MGGNGRGVVICTGANSQFGKLLKLIQTEATPRTPLQESMDKLGKQLSAVSLAVIALITAVGCFQVSLDYKQF